MPSPSDLPPADAALCAREAALPGLASVLDAPGLAAAAGLGEMRHAYLRHKPGTSCVAGLIPVDGSLAAYAAMTYPAERWAEVRARPSWNRGVGRAIFLDDRPAVLVPLALERRLRPARALADPVARSALLASVGLSGCTLRLLRYKPGRRIVLRADGPDGPRAVLKLHADDGAFGPAAAGAQHAARRGGPALIGTAADHRAVATAWVPGRSLDADAGPDSHALAGATLAAMHNRPSGADLPPWRAPAPGTAAETLAALLPRLEAVARRLALGLPDRPQGLGVPLHGDFSAEQVVIGDEGAALVDWDRAAIGPAARDLGSALARLDLDAIRGAVTGAAADALLDGYASVLPPPPPVEIAAHRAHALLALAAEGFRDRRPRWDEEAEAVLDRLAALFHAPPRRPNPAPMPGLDRALDAEGLRPALAAALHGELPGGPVSVALTRLKPGRRAMLRYALPDGRVLLGKLRAKGADAHTPGLQAGLRRAGLDGTAGVGVPAVAGVLAEPALWLQEAVPGRALGELLDGLAPQARDAMRRTGRALAALHATPPQTTRRWTLADELDVLARAVEDSPHADLHASAVRRLAALAPAPEVGLHRDFYVDQILIAPGTVWLVDLDLHARGDATVDLGNFLAHLTELALRRGRDAAHHAPLGAAFLGGYAEHRPLPPPARIEALHWVSLARHVAIAARFPDRRAAIPAIAALCRERLSDQPPADTRFTIWSTTATAAPSTPR